MKRLLALKTLLFCSLLLLALFSCKQDTKNEYNIEQTNKVEKGRIKKLLLDTRELISKKEFKAAIDSLDVIINSYGTHEEVEVAYDLREETEQKYILDKIRTQNNIDSLLVYLDEYNQKDIKKDVKNKIKDILSETDDVYAIQEYLDSNKLPEYRASAKNRLEELKASAKKEAYAEATSENSAKKWKEFLELYPDFEKKEQIKDRIIGLEVDDIFSGKYEDIPKAVRSGNVNTITSSVSIKNDTPYTLTVLYSGVENKRMVITSGQSELVKLKSGNYRVTASVSSANVTNYAGKELLQGSYSSSFYIR